MTETMTITKARAELTRIPKKLTRGNKAKTLTVTHHGKPVLAILPWEHYEAIVETLEVLSDREMMDALRKSAEDIKKGRLYTHEEVGKRLGL